MRVIIIGGGKLGYRIAETLSIGNYDVIVIDQSQEVIDRINNNLDVMALRYNGLVGTTLKELNMTKNDWVIAVTGSDEGNMLACMSSKEMGIGKTIARIRNPEYSNDLVVSKEQLSIDYIINPEKSTANEITRILTLSPAGTMEDFADGKIYMIEIAIDNKNPYIEKKIKQIDTLENLLIAAISRKGEIIIPTGETSLELDDHIFIMGKKMDSYNFCKAIGKTWKRPKNVMIIGGSRITHYLAENLIKQGSSVKIIEKDLARCEELAEELPNALVINGDGSEIDTLKSENISNMDAVISLTGMDEQNVVLSLFAKEFGVNKVVSKISKLKYISMVENIGIDKAVNPNTITVAEVMKIIRGEKVLSLCLLLDGLAEVMEFVVPEECKVTNIQLKKIDFPKNAIIAAIMHENKVIIPHGDNIIYPNDKVVVLSKASEVEKIKKLFNIKDVRTINGIQSRIQNLRYYSNR